MKKMKNFIALLLALVMTMSLMACGNKTDEETKTGEDIGCYVQTTESGEKVLVDKDGNAVTDYTLDDEGNVVDTQGVVVVKAADITAYEKSEERMRRTRPTHPRQILRSLRILRSPMARTSPTHRRRTPRWITLRRTRPRRMMPSRKLRSPLTTSRTPRSLRPSPKRSLRLSRSPRSPQRPVTIMVL